MSDEPTKYVLRQKEIYAEEDSRSYLVSLSREGEALGKMEKYVFDELFVPVSDLSRENQPEHQLHKSHVADTISGALAQGYDPTDAVWKLLEESGLI